ncbi:MAG: T9SS type A sorting domain-containing protein [Ferruginibacter sp.]|nr:T9SS type A sorting domain-containing protein [Ferruginibacter sp.]
MKKFLLLFSLALCICADVMAQPATYALPFSIGRERCGSTSGATLLYQHPTSGDRALSYDSLYFFNYVSPNLSRSTLRSAYFPRLRVGNSTYVRSGVTYRDRFNISASSVSFNPKDGKLYYLWTDYNGAVSPTLKTYVWRWNPDTTFFTGSYNNPAVANLRDTLASFVFDIGGITFDNLGNAWQLEFSNPPAPYKSRMRRLDFVTNTIDPVPDTLDLIGGAGGIGDTMWNVGSGDITLMPNGQMYYVFDNKLFTPDYGSYGAPGHHITSTYIDSVRRPGAVNLVGLAYGNGDLISSFSPGCVYRRIDPVTGDTNFVNYTYLLNKGVQSSDMSQISSGLGLAKRLASITPTGTAGQYDVAYDIVIKNYGTTGLTNLQVFDSLSKINGAANLSNVSTTMLTIPPPPGIALNAGFNGNTDARLLQFSGQNLQNYPVDSSSFTVRVNCRISNVVQGVVYYNSAVGFASGYKGVALRDSSTNGSVPDLNQNDKPDDLGESTPTPFLIAVDPINSACATLTAVLYTENFGAGPIGGSGLLATLPSSPNTSSSTYTGTTVQPIAKNAFAITDTARKADLANFSSLRDHTGNANGRMLVVNGDAPPRIIFRDTLPTSCPGRQYSFSFWTAFPYNATYQSACDALGGFRYPKFRIRFRDISTGLTAVEDTTTNITTNNSWTQFGYRWTMPIGYSNLIMEIVNDAPGGCGNDFLLDDIVYGSCDALPVVNTTSQTGCLGDSVRFVGSLADSLVLPGPKDHQWQIANSAGGPWTDIPGATSPTYLIYPIVAADTGKFYRLKVAAQGSIAIPICTSLSPGVKLNGQTASVAATSADRNKNNVCPGITVKVYRTGGTLGVGATWRWYTGSPGGTLVGTGDTLTFTAPAATTTYYVRAEGTCNTTPAQAVTINISCDIDKDKDGIPDYIESNIAAAVANGYNTGYPGYKDYNNDFINDDFQADGDSDNDGIPNYLDLTYPGRVDLSGPLGVPDGIDDRFDIDLDGIINMLDLDSDNDGIPDVVEAYGVDANGDGRLDNFTDTDGDGLSQNVDPNNTGANNSGTGLALPNLDGDIVPNFLDLDSDNDGIPDVIEVGGIDANNNGIIDAFVDANTDGLHDGYINGTALLITGADGNSDGRADSWPNKNLDMDIRPNAYDLDSDGDGITDVIEAGLPDANLNGLADGVIGINGWSTTVSAMPALNLRNTDAVGNPDYLDIDSDEDGIPDNIEGISTAAYAMPTLTDADGDGLMLPYDNQPAVYGGTGITPYDHDGDSTPDYRDLDSDADGLSDRVEGNDYNLNGLPDDLVTPTGLDADGDGLDNRYDSLNSTLIVKGTSPRMGAGGSFTGDATPGARTPVQRTMIPPFQVDRDWRFAGFVLPVQFVKLAGQLQANDKVPLSWTIIATTPVDRFEVERSTDNRNFIKAGTVSQTVNLNVQQTFNFTDDVSSVSKEVIYYRIKVIGKAGEIQYSNILVIRKQQSAKPTLTIAPNPANEYVSIGFYADKETDITIRLLDESGKMVLVQKQKVSRGSNTLQLTGLSKYSNGNYMLQVFINDEVITQKLVLLHK